MLVEFSVKNFRSFKEPATLSMSATKLASRGSFNVDQNNIINNDKHGSLLRSTVIYGANASGKSNIVQAIRDMRSIILKSNSLYSQDNVRVEPFLFDIVSKTEPVSFEIVFIIGDIKYRYGFSISPKDEVVLTEWLYSNSGNSKSYLFERNGSEIKVNSKTFSKASSVRKHTRDNALFLTVAAQLKVAEAQLITEWFLNQIVVFKADDVEAVMDYSMAQLFEGGEYSDRMQSLVRLLDPSILELFVTDGSDSNTSRIYMLPYAHIGSTKISSRIRETNSIANNDVNTNKIFSRHATRDASGVVENDEICPIHSVESDGTIKMIAWSGPLIDVLSKGKTLVFDELDARLHPILTRQILGLFNSNVTNNRNAQLICTTHDTNLLDRAILRRDQIYFVEKDERQCSHLYSLADFRVNNRIPRNDEDYEKNYILGKYGAIPYFGSIDNIFMLEEA